ncbi:hypothetical protein IscW_ISCW017320 [Ixodes scapularis]|uniref:Uncharacterized protein n=1 Tax=Ixodes scapularis TaxID=6945 RepID=B7P9Y7_IXOSC|nr:hypothetical protein IscW_ISCW017320 [Ixodes scapularis]|eukprot:XP_002405853.1 hypothetical protein IscW_ISCW017320 [Ixodes scapularis]
MFANKGSQLKARKQPPRRPPPPMVRDLARVGGVPLGLARPLSRVLLGASPNRLRCEQGVARRNSRCKRAAAAAAGWGQAGRAEHGCLTDSFEPVLGGTAKLALKMLGAFPWLPTPPLCRRVAPESGSRRPGALPCPPFSAPFGRRSPAPTARTA